LETVYFGCCTGQRYRFATNTLQIGIKEKKLSKEMTSENYVENVIKTDCVYDTKLAVRLVESARMLHAAMGLVTEAAELLDMLKKHIYYGKKLDMVNAKEEIGDSSWYIGLAVDEMKTTMNEVLTLNIEKLKLRYPNKFTSEDAINRDVDAERELLEKAKMPIYVQYGNELGPLGTQQNITTSTEAKEIAVELLKKDSKDIWMKYKDLPVPSVPPPVHHNMCCGNISFSSLIYKSIRAKEWLEFASEVADHVENYTTKQYGDKPNDQAEGWSIEHCIEESKKYANRYGKNQREGQDVLGFLKTAHYTQIAASKHKESFGKENNNK
jgi:NTP pyrophosphatase (non-canonical NTP hydrolase)